MTEIFIIITIGVIVFFIFMFLDAILYIGVPYEIRAGHWWSHMLGSGFYAKYLQIKYKIK